MKDYGISVLTQYQMEVFGTHKVRGAILCDTDKGLLLLRRRAWRRVGSVRLQKYMSS